MSSPSTTRVAYRYLSRQAKSPLEDALQALETLHTLDRELTDVEDAFARHFKMAGGLDPEVNSQLEALSKARKGLTGARAALAAVEAVALSFPDDKTVQRVLKDADVMIRRFEKHAAKAHKMVQQLSKKQLPPALAKLSKSVAAAIKRRLVDPKVLQVLPWQQTRNFYLKGGYRGRNVDGVEYQVVFRIVDPGLGHQGRAEMILGESTVLSTGPYISGGVYTEPTDQKKATANFIAMLEGWKGMKGQADAISGRAATAQAVAQALTRALRGMRSFDTEDVEISRDNKHIEGAYRTDNLPKEGARDQGEYVYREQVNQEVASWRAILDPKLTHYMSEIKKIEVSDGEKGWIYTYITLK